MTNHVKPSFVPTVLRGSLITLRRKCGRDGCRCCTEEPHATPALSYNLEGSTKMLTLRPQDVPVVRAALKRYQKRMRALKLEALAGIRALRKHIVTQKARARGSGK